MILTREFNVRDLPIGLVVLAFLAGWVTGSAFTLIVWGVQ